MSTPVELGNLNQCNRDCSMASNMTRSLRAYPKCHNHLTEEDGEVGANDSPMCRCAG